MADATVNSDVINATLSDLRRENAAGHGELDKTIGATGWAMSNRMADDTDRVVNQNTQYYIAGQNVAFSNATALAALKASTDASSAGQLAAITIAAERSASAAALEAAKTAATLALGHAVLGQQIIVDGNLTRTLINDRNVEALNRELIERNALLVDARVDGRFWQHGANNAQYAALSSQMNAFQSQLQETRQNLVNFGTMAGVGQSSANNAVR